MSGEAERTMAPIVKLRKQAEKAAEKLGLTVQQFAVIPDDGHGHSHVSAMFSKSPDVAMAGPERDEEFDKLMEGQRIAEQEARAEQARQELLETLSDTVKNPDNGIGLDDD